MRVLLIALLAAISYAQTEGNATIWKCTKHDAQTLVVNLTSHSSMFLQNMDCCEFCSKCVDAAEHQDCEATINGINASKWCDSSCEENESGESMAFFLLITVGLMFMLMFCLYLIFHFGSEPYSRELSKDVSEISLTVEKHVKEGDKESVTQLDLSFTQHHNPSESRLLTYPYEQDRDVVTNELRHLGDLSSWNMSHGSPRTASKKITRAESSLPTFDHFETVPSADSNIGVTPDRSNMDSARSRQFISNTISIGQSNLNKSEDNLKVDLSNRATVSEMSSSNTYYSNIVRSSDIGGAFAKKSSMGGANFAKEVSIGGATFSKEVSIHSNLNFGKKTSRGGGVFGKTESVGEGFNKNASVGGGAFARQSSMI